MNSTITYINPVLPNIIQSRTIVNGEVFNFSYCHYPPFDGKMSEDERQQLVSNYHEYFTKKK